MEFLFHIKGQQDFPDLVDIRCLCLLKQAVSMTAPEAAKLKTDYFMIIL